MLLGIALGRLVLTKIPVNTPLAQSCLLYTSTMTMKNKLYFIIVATLLCPTSLYAQSGTDKRAVLSFQTGPTLYTGKLIGIAGYSSNLRNGIAKPFRQSLLDLLTDENGALLDASAKKAYQNYGY